MVSFPAKCKIVIDKPEKSGTLTLSKSLEVLDRK